MMGAMNTLTKKLTYDATAEAVSAMLDDPEFREAVLEKQQVVRGSATVDGDVVTIEQVRGADDLPSFARSFVGDEILIVQTENWTSPTSADVRLTIPGKPGEAVGTLELVESGGTTTETVTLDITVKIPLVGGRIEKLIAGIISSALDVEQRVGREWLAR
jgi:hypothetical protein